MSGRSLAPLILAGILGVAAVACSDEAGPSTASPEPTATVAPPTSAVPATEPSAPPAQGAPSDGPTAAPPSSGPDPAAADVTLETVAELDEPIDLVTRPADGAVVVAERGGRIVVLAEGGDTETLLDISDLTAPGGERGLLGIAFAPDGQFLYVSYTDTGGDSQLDEYALVDGLRVDPGSRRTVLGQAQPFPNHNGGGVVFGPDGLLYYGLGDGGSGGDPLGAGQDPSTLLGKILRISPRPVGDSPYAIPSDNPFLDQDGARGEIWLLGARNPWRFSFDPATGDLWVADVGQDRFEEVNHLPAASGAGRGTNLGWNLYEGTEPFADGASAEGLTMPVHTYGHGADGCSVTGGVVYRGSAIPALNGAYLFSDYCSGGVQALVPDGSGGATVTDLGLDVPTVVGFGVDAAGEVYVLSFDGTVLRIAPT